MAKSARSNRKKDLHAQRRQALLQSEGYQKTQQALAARLQTLNQAAEADQAIIEELRKTEAAAAMDAEASKPQKQKSETAGSVMDMDAAPRQTRRSASKFGNVKKIRAGPKWSKKKPKRRSSHTAASLAWA